MIDSGGISSNPVLHAMAQSFQNLPPLPTSGISLILICVIPFYTFQFLPLMAHLFSIIFSLAWEIFCL
jgi:hypothetical protein